MPFNLSLFVDIRALRRCLHEFFILIWNKMALLFHIIVLKNILIILLKRSLIYSAKCKIKINSVFK